jgi:hypothetical protein
MRMIMINWRVINSLSMIWALIINALGIITLFFLYPGTLHKQQGVFYSARRIYLCK